MFGRREKADVGAGVASRGPVDDTDPSQAPTAERLLALARGARDPSTDTPALLEAERSAAYLRYNGILAAYVPWLLRHVGRSGLLVEIGCGSGSSTAAFAHATDRLVAYDIDPEAVSDANRRLGILGLTNAEARQVPPGGAAEAIAQHPDADGVIFYASIEHLSRSDRRAALGAAWAGLKPGGFILIGETRNVIADREDFAEQSIHFTPQDLSAALGPDYGSHIVSRPDDAEIAGIFGDQAAAEARIRERQAAAGWNLHSSLMSAHLSVLIVKPEPDAIAAPTSAAAAAGAPVDVAGIEALRAFARDPANFDAFADLMCEVLGPQVYLTWDHDAAYKRHFKRWQKAGFTVLPNHYYSPIPDLNELTDAQLTARYPLHGVAIDEGEHRALLEAFKSVQAETTAFRSRNTPTTDGRWYSGGAFGLLDAQVAYAMVRTQKPKRIIEIGTGFSTLAMAEACERNAAEGRPVEFTTIDPYPSFAVALNPKGLTRNLTVPVESLPIEQFEALEPGDILFIDSTHIIRPGGDVEYEYFHILPRLKPGVWIHVHDIFFPLPYPPEWARDRHIFWNEQQLLNAFLAYNHSFRSKMALSAACDRWIDAVKDAFPGTGDRPGPGSFWMQRIA